jgi:hypothetical protein
MTYNVVPSVILSTNRHGGVVHRRIRAVIKEKAGQSP